MPENKRFAKWMDCKFYDEKRGGKNRNAVQNDDDGFSYTLDGD